METHRLSPIDIARGMIMVVMALDHTRDFFHESALVFDPTNLDKTTPLLFITRWITHFCAPGFVFLAGTAAFISGTRKSRGELSRFLLTRGIWLIVLEVVVLRTFFFFNFYYDVTFLTVLWVIGWCMICLAALIYLPLKWTLGIGLVIIFFHDAWVLIPIEPSNILYAPWVILMGTGFLPVSPSVAFIISYPIIPWLGIMLVGYSAGKLYTAYDTNTRVVWLMRIGLTALALFIVLRLLNLYGDPTPWQSQANPVLTLLSFINTTKYPVSLQFVCMTLGPLLLLLAGLERTRHRFSFFLTFGRVPLFYFLVHFLLIHAVALIAFVVKTGKSLSEIDFHFSKSFGGITPGVGHNLGWTYLTWLGIVLALYPVCKWYGHYKKTHTHAWLRYL